MSAFDAIRYEHRLCISRHHYAIFESGKFRIVHNNDLVMPDYTWLLSFQEIHGSFVSEAQRELLRNRILEYLKGKA